MDPSFLAFLGVSAIVIATPGPDTALTVRNTLLGGRKAGVLTGLGVAAGQIAWVVATSLGLVAVILASAPVFRMIKLLGAIYLLYLGAQSLRAALRRPRPEPAPLAPGGRSPFPGPRAFRQGVINNLANPKMAIFFVSVLPQFAARGHGMLSALVLLGLVFATMTFLWLALYSAVVAKAGAFVRGSRARRAIDGAAGAALVGLGVKMAVEER
jgi:threonine/homoserine/homoserine lactone efflux protein